MMSKNAVIFNEISPQLAEVIEFLGRIGLTIHYGVDGKDCLDLIETNKPELAILGVAMPGLSGIEISRRIKLDSADTKAKIILIADFDNESLKDRAMDAGCDLYLAMADLPSALYSHVQAIFKEPPRTELRVQVSKDLLLTSENRKVKGKTINVSRSGVLVSSQENFDLGSQVKCSITTGEGVLELPGIVARLIDLPQQEEEKKFGLGIKFTNPHEGAVERLETFLKLQGSPDAYDFKGKKIDLKPFIDLVLSEDAYFAEMLGNIMRSEQPAQEQPDGSEGDAQAAQAAAFKPHFPKLQSWEIVAFAGGTEETEVYLSVIRQLIMLFIKFDNVSRILNDIPYSDREDERMLFNVLETALEMGTSAEKQTGEILNSEISMRSVGLASQIAKTSNRYIDAKVRLLIGLIERYKPIMERKSYLAETVAAFETILVDMKLEAVEKKKEAHRPKEEKKEKTKEKEIYLSAGKKSSMLAYGIGAVAFLALIIGGIMLYNALFAGRINVDKYAEPGFIKSGKVEEGVLTLICEDSWNQSRDGAVTREALTKIYDKLKKDRMTKIKLKDSSGKLIAQVLSNEMKEFLIIIR